MQPQDQQIKDLQNQIVQLKGDLDNLTQSFYKNNFSNTQTFNKDVIFQGRLKVPHYTSAPSVAEIGDLIEVGGTLYICTTAGSVSSPATFTVVGTQS